MIDLMRDQRVDALGEHRCAIPEIACKKRAAEVRPASNVAPAHECAGGSVAAWHARRSPPWARCRWDRAITTRGRRRAQCVVTTSAARRRSRGDVAARLRRGSCRTNPAPSSDGRGERRHALQFEGVEAVAGRGVGGGDALVDHQRQVHPVRDARGEGQRVVRFHTSAPAAPVQNITSAARNRCIVEKP